MGEVYFEKQKRMLCAVHALNNFFQKENEFTKEELDQICTELSPNCFINPHKNAIGLGDYDVNVIISALKKRNLSTEWFDRRRNSNQLVFNKIEGFILNMPSMLKLGNVNIHFFQRKHWVTIRKISDEYILFDSKEDNVKHIGNELDATKYINEKSKQKDVYILVIVKNVIADDGSWIVRETKLS